MPEQFLLRDDFVRRIEAELNLLDAFLAQIAGASGTITNHCKGVPGRQVSLVREDQTVVSLSICPFLIGQSGEAEQLQYAVAVVAWADGRGGDRRHWHRGAEWTIALSTAKGVEAARLVIEEAWRQALAVDQRRILGEDGGAAALG